MFDLESSVTGWRQKLFSAGITRATLDELESHLREEIARQSASGLNEFDAFRSAVQKIGQPVTLSMEFQKSAFWLGEKNARWINRLLGGVWLVYSSVSFTKLGRGMWPEISRASSAHTPMFFLGLLLDLVYFIGIIASLGIFNGARVARHYLLFLAGLDAFCGVIALLLKPNQPACAFYTIAGFITLWLLWPQSKAKLAAK